MSAGLFHLGPIVVDPSFEGGEGLIEGSSKVGQLVLGSGVEATGVEVSHDQAVTFRPPESVSEHFVRDSVKGVIEFLVSAASVE